MHFQDDDWFKLALLTWDRIARVRPKGVGDLDGELVRQVREESDLLLDIQPSRADLDTVANAFSRILVGPGADAGEFGELAPLRSVYDAARFLGSDPDVGLYRMPPNWHSPFPHSSLFWVYAGSFSKISQALREDLVRAGLAVERRDAGPWLGMHPKVGSVYMAALADAMARSNAMSPVTDEPSMHYAVGALDRLASLLHGRSPYLPIQEAQSAYMHLALAAAIRPQGIAAVPVSRLLEFRRRHSAELAAFQEHVESLAAELAQVAEVENPVVAQAHLQALYERTTKRHLDELRGALRAFGIESTVGVLQVKVDLGTASGTALGAAAAAGGHLELATAATVLTVVPYLYHAVRERRGRRANSPAAYLLSASKEFNRAGFRP
ncbi:DUF6236 family protein [Streptomyces polygonati]|uniref:DUF6236 family protein n=1 Tax=Streptomyces polygonati TaxID=1617087 RepID=A0ABV8HLW4_9ACTN